MTDTRPAGGRGWSWLTTTHRITLLAAVMSLTAVAVFVIVVQDLPGLHAPVGLPWWMWVAAFAAGEVMVVWVQLKRDAHGFTLTDLVLVAGLYLGDPATVVVTQLVGTGLALALRHRQTGLKLAFNLAQNALTGSLAVVVFTELARGTDWDSLWRWTAALITVAATTLAADVCLFAALSISEGSLHVRELPRMLALSLPFAVGVAAMGQLVAYLAAQSPGALLLLVLPSALLFSAYRAYTHAREQQNNLRLLHEITSLLYNSDNATAALTNFLTSVRGAFKAEVAELVLLGDGQAAVTVSRSSEGHEPIALLPLEDTSDVSQVVDWATGNGVLTSRTRTTRGSQLDCYAARRGFKDAMVTVLQTEDRVHGLLLVGNRLGDVATFSDSDLTLLGTLARHVATSMDRGRLERDLRQVTELKEELRHQAMHDALTGLPNRTLFLDRTQHAVHLAGRNGLWPAVLYIDLDGFKPVNDTHGHEAGDLLLQAFAQRLQDSVRAADTAARLGGDEFAVLLHGPVDRAGIQQVLSRVRAQLDLPIDLGAGRVARIGASIGVAIAEPGIDVDGLVRCADSAMYAAKRGGRNRDVFYDPGLVEPDGRRPVPSAEPAGALGHGEFTVV
ncbi:diguanylate cyclase [Blastococcus sp. CT_GayMR20]|uniref:diguanylate cyclase domain-containing protein n=1 Tax=Blastococcus sp. CT_GayMR20 TaxID=2559609 RepID=UPI00142F7ED3|nr:diguanylate cyclase [Blastococcus sp. CT_GayMR20]